METRPHCAAGATHMLQGSSAWLHPLLKGGYGGSIAKNEVQSTCVYTVALKRGVGAIPTNAGRNRSISPVFPNIL